MKVSFVIPFHNEEINCIPMIERVVSYAKKKNFIFEVIRVDDRSSDRTAILLAQITKKHRSVKPIYRKHDKEEKGNTMGRALLAGTKSAKGDFHRRFFF